MKTFTYYFDGEALGGQMTVVAPDRKTADKLAKKTLKRNYVNLEDPVKSLNLKYDSEAEFDPSGTVVHYWNGDY